VVVGDIGIGIADGMRLGKPHQSKVATDAFVEIDLQSVVIRIAVVGVALNHSVGFAMEECRAYRAR
jgi:hypothetical protein